MSILTPFGTLDYDDENALKNWSGPHAIRHMTYVKEMGRRGLPVTTATLFGALDHDWYGRHWLNHAALNQVKDGATALSSFEASWKDENSFYTWHRAHNRAHARIERAFGMVTE